MGMSLIKKSINRDVKQLQYSQFVCALLLTIQQPIACLNKCMELALSMRGNGFQTIIALIVTHVLKAKSLRYRSSSFVSFKALWVVI